MDYSIGDPVTHVKTAERYATCEEADVAAIEASFSYTVEFSQQVG